MGLPSPAPIVFYTVIDNFIRFFDTDLKTLVRDRS